MLTIGLPNNCKFLLKLVIFLGYRTGNLNLQYAFLKSILKIMNILPNGGKSKEMQSEQSNNSLKKSESDSGKQTVDLAAPGVAKAVSKRILEDIDNYCVKTYDGGHRNHLGASLIGRECKRQLWYIFRWCLREPTTGRQQRLFNRGHREEARFIEWLRGIGFEVWAETEDGKQYRISGVNGHFGGSLDGIGKLPPASGIDEAVLLEFKTNGTGAGFNKLDSHGMPIAKPDHFAQTSTYGFKYGFRFCAYLNINKNDDSLHVEIVKLDHNLGAQMEMKAEQIIHSKTAPARLSDNPTYRGCGWCAMKGICHNGEMPEKNCRSCTYALPVENAEWFCSLPAHNSIIPAEFIPKGCGNWQPITKA